ncbi:MAG: hypothetical protein M1824_002072, partial [Vezdaea acicularis]
ENILELLCNLLSPIDHHRQAQPRSKGKRSKKRKRAADSQPTPSDEVPSRTDPPEITKHLTIGFNSTNQALEALAQLSRPSSMASLRPGKASTAPDPASASEKPSVALKPLAVIFFRRSDQALGISSHLPLLSHVASLAFPNSSPTRLVALPAAAEARLAECLGIPRVCFLGLLEDAPGAENVIRYIREHVAVVSVPWLSEASQGTYLPLQVKEVSVAPKSGNVPAGLSAKKAIREAKQNNKKSKAS